LPPRGTPLCRQSFRSCKHTRTDNTPSATTYPATVADLRWVTSREFLDYDFPPADEKTMSKLLGLVRN